jgi:hypothetical protein
MAKLGRYDVEVEYLDKDGNVWDSHCVLLTDDYDEAYKTAMETEVSENEQVAIWEWDENESVVEDSWVVKEFSK